VTLFGFLLEIDGALLCRHLTSRRSQPAAARLVVREDLVLFISLVAGGSAFYVRHQDWFEA
jgi:hypothetical protein